jgi:hypothetical protein
MTRSRKLVITGAAVLALGAGGVGIAQAVGGDSEEQVTGPEADQVGGTVEVQLGRDLEQLGVGTDDGGAGDEREGADED